MDKFRFYDNTKVTAFKECPRYFYLRHVLGWTLSGKVAAPLVFGTSWHAAMDALWTSYHKLRSDAERIDYAMEGFYEGWASEGYSLDLSLDDIIALKPRTPATAESMVSRYIDERRHLLENAELIQAEQPFAVPLFEGSEPAWYAGKLDKVIKMQGDLIVLEHKTTTSFKKDGGFRYDFLDQFVNNSQVDGYLYGGTMLYGGIKYVYVDAALVHEKERHFKILPNARSTSGLSVWLDETRYWVATIEHARQEVANGRPLAATFPRATNNCVGKYSTCPYLHVCSTLNTREDFEKLGGPEAGFIVNHWEPFNELHLDKIFAETQAQV